MVMLEALTGVSADSVEALGARGMAGLLWAMATVGGDRYFEEDMEAVLRVIFPDALSLYSAHVLIHLAFATNIVKTD